MEYNRTSGFLTCVSTGGPASSVTWKKDSVDTNFSRSQTITDTESATYVNRLSLNQDPANVVGVHTCYVNNLRGTSETLSLQLRGEVNNVKNKDLQVTDPGEAIWVNPQANIIIKQICYERCIATFFCQNITVCHFNEKVCYFDVN